MSETDFLKLKKHDNVETNTEKFDIENYLNGNWDKIDENVGEVNTNISNINSKSTELEKELKEAQEDFYQNSIRGQASGEYIHVEDSSNCRAKIGIGGNQEQETRSGKNYLNTLAKYKAGEKVTVDGITYIFNEDGSITCNGTATADSVLTFSSNLQTINGSGKKIVGMITGTQVPAKLSILAYTSDWSKNTFELLSNVNKNITTNMQENIDYTIFRIIAYKGTTLNNQTIYYQILDTSVNDLTYEQYGVSPSPDYLNKVVAVGSNVNLFNKDTATLLDNIYIDATSQKIGSASGYCSLYLSCKPNKTYTVSKIQSARFCIAYSDSSTIKVGDTVNVMKAENSSTVLTGKTGANAKTLIIMYSKSSEETVTKQEILDSIKIVEGTEVGEYSKHGQGCVKVTKCNKNIYDKNKEIICNGVGIGANGELFSRSDQKLLIIPIYREEKNIAISFTKTFSYNLRYAFSDTIVENTNSEIFNADYVENSTTTNIKVNKIIQNNKHNYLLLGFTNKDNYSDLQVEYAKVVSAYEEHQEQSYIMPIQKEMLEGDYFDWDNEEEVHVWNKLILDGMESITLNSNYNDCTLFELVKSDCYVAVDTKKYAKSNYFISGNKDLLASNSGSNMVGLGTSKGRIWINISNSIVGTSDKLNNFKTFLKSKYDAGTPVIIYYKTVAETRLKFTDEQKAVAKELNNARTYKNVTNITTDSKAILSLDYAKDLETLLTSKESEV